MITEIDLRDYPPHEFQKRIYDALDKTETDAEVLVIADRDIDAFLIQYQIERDCALDWAHEDPDAEPRARPGYLNRNRSVTGSWGRSTCVT